MLIHKILLITVFQVIVAQNIQSTQKHGEPLLGKYQNPSTTYTGIVGNVTSITSLSLSQGQNVNLNLTNFQSNPSATTLMFFFKPIQITNQAQLLLFNGIACFFPDAYTINCNTLKRQTLEVSFDLSQMNSWMHFLLSVSQQGSAILQIRMGLDVIAQDSISKFEFSQTTPKSNSVCFGLCDQLFNKLSFTGQIREVMVKSSSINLETIGPNFINIVQAYTNDTLGYYRLIDVFEQFSKSKIKVFNGTTSLSPKFYFEQIPIDVCSSNFNFKNVSMATGLQLIQKISTNSTKLLTKSYSYTMSITFMANRTTCNATTSGAASSYCHIVNFAGVFLLYFTKPNMARFYFLSDKNYFETQTIEFFIPYNQWTTIQMTMSQYTGYQVVVLDSNANILSKFSKIYNMNQQVPTNQLSLLKGFNGLVSRFLLNQKSVQVPTPNSLLGNGLFNLDFSNVTQNLTLSNPGSVGKMQLLQYVTSSVPYKVFEFGQVQQISETLFDGITCNDKHLTAQLQNSQLPIQFQFNVNNSVQATIQFWFKFGDKSWYTPSLIEQDFEIFQISSINTFGQNTYFQQVYLSDIYNSTSEQIERRLLVAPFGLSLQSTVIPVMQFPMLNQNEDEQQWWHLSCSYNTLNTYCVLYNTLSQVKIEKTLVNLRTLPTGNFTGKFLNRVDQLFIKEFRYWQKYQTIDQVQKNRYNMLTSPDLLYSSSFRDYYVLKQDYTNFTTLLYNPLRLSLENVTNKQFHTICPYQTYYMNGLCYRNPSYKLSFAIFPSFTNNKLYWLLTLNQTSLINNNITNLQAKFTSVENGLNSYSNNLYALWAQDFFRQESQYKIQSTLTNGYFTQFSQLGFIPNICKWFEVFGYDAFSAYEVFNQMTGTDDIIFKLQLVKNPNVDCTADFDYFDTFDPQGFGLEFIIDDDQYFIDQPIVDWQLSEDNKSVILNITKDQQYKLPLWTDIKVMMTIKWMSSDFIRPTDAIFQNALYKFQIAPDSTQTILEAQIDVNTQQVSTNQTLILNANKTSLLGVDPSLVQQFLSYQWICPEEISCNGQNDSSIVYIPYSFDQNFDFQKTYNFSLIATFNNTIVAQNSVNITWLNCSSIPQFQINCKIGLDTDPTYCNVNSIFEKDTLSLYSISWSSLPNIKNDQSREFILYPPWQPDTSYLIIAQVGLIQQPSCQRASLSFNIQNQTALLIDPINSSINFTVPLPETDNTTKPDNSTRLLDEQNFQSADEFLLEFLNITTPLSIDQMVQYENLIRFILPNVTDFSVAIDCYDFLVKENGGPAYFQNLLSDIIEQSKLIYNNDSIAILAIDRLLDQTIYQGYKTKQFELNFYRMSLQDVMFKVSYGLQALDTTYLLQCEEIYNQIEDHLINEYFAVQIIAVRGLYNETIVHLRVKGEISGLEHDIGELLGLSTITFQTGDDRLFREGQTQCAAYTIENTWSYDLCYTHHNIGQNSVDCICNGIEGSYIQLRTDFSQDKDQPLERNWSNEASQLFIRGVSYFYLAFNCLICFFGLLGSYFATKLDQFDWKIANQEIKVKWQLNILKKLAEAENQPFQRIKLRSKQIMSYKVIEASNIAWVTAAIHPIISPLNQFDPEKPRILRFNAYFFQINCFISICLIIFNGPDYRKGDIDRSIHVLDAKDISWLFIAIFIGSIVLLPFMLHPISNLLKNKLLIQDDKFEIEKKFAKPRIIFIFFNIMIDIAILIASIFICKSSEATNQYLIVLSVLGGLFFSTLVSNMLWVLWNIYMPSKWYKDSKAVEVLTDLKHLKSILLEENQDEEGAIRQIDDQQIEIEMTDFSGNPPAIKEGTLKTSQKSKFGILHEHVKPKIAGFSIVHEQAPESARNDQDINHNQSKKIKEMKNSAVDQRNYEFQNQIENLERVTTEDSLTIKELPLKALFKQQE